MRHLIFRCTVDLHHLLSSPCQYCHPAAASHLIYIICCCRRAAVVALLIYAICCRRTSTKVGLGVPAQEPHQSLLAAESQVSLAFSFSTLARSCTRPSVAAKKVSLATPGCPKFAL